MKTDNVKYTLQKLQADAISEPGHILQHGELQTSDWWIDGRKIVHERAWFPWNFFKQSTVHYWSETVFTDKAIADREAEKFNATVEKCFYCDDENPAWFLIFDDLDEAFSQALPHLNALTPLTP